VSQLERLLEALAVPMPVDLVGVSMGAEIAAAFAARRSDLVRKLRLIDPQAMDGTWKTIFPMNIRGVGEYIMAVYVIPFVLSSPRSDFSRPESASGWADRFAPQTRYRGFRRVLTAIPQAEFHAIPDAGHLSEGECADVVHPVLAAFFAPGRQPRSPR